MFAPTIIKDLKMSNELLLNIGAVLALIPASVMGAKTIKQRDTMHWLLLSVATIGPLAAIAVNLSGEWQTDFSTSLWVTIAFSMSLFMATSILMREAWRLTSLMTTYMIILGILATIWGHAEDVQGMPQDGFGLWIGLHIAVSIGTYGLVTIAAVAALGAVFQERSLKTKRQTPLVRTLPSVADCDFMVVRLLIVSEVVLAFGLLSGMALQFSENHEILALNHKSILTISAFLVIGGLLLTHYKSGLRGRKAARIVLLAYLLLTLGYPGVKFVSDIVLS
jgi:ABC-type uncharacterized transport system permease subunit